MSKYWRKAPLTLSLLWINSLVWLLQVAGGVNPFDPPAVQILASGGNSAPLTLGGQAWRLLSSMFVHFGAVHLLVNLTVLWVTGGVAERLLGRLQFAAVYLLSGLAGSLCSALWSLLQPQAIHLSAGASGALMGILGSMLVLAMLPQRGHLPRPVLAFIGTVVLLNVLLGLLSDSVDNAAHLGGLLAGILLTVWLELVQRWLAPRVVSLLLALLLGVSLLLLILYSPGLPPPPPPMLPPASAQEFF